MGIAKGLVVIGWHAIAEATYRGCMIGGADYKREMRYNRVVKTALGLPLDELDLEKI
jgi:hypothetical protein